MAQSEAAAAVGISWRSGTQQYATLPRSFCRSLLQPSFMYLKSTCPRFLPIRRQERKQQEFKSRASAQKFLATHAVVYNAFNLQPHLIRRPPLRHLQAAARRTWAAATAAA